jgi:hypothetical protein
MLVRAPRALFLFASSIALLTAAPPALADSIVFENQHKMLTIPLSPTKAAPLHLSYYEFNGESGTERTCEATISVPLSLYPSARLAARPADFASEIREVLDAWGASKCSVQVWLQNDTDDDLSEEESCLSEDFRYDGDSVWSVSSESFCYHERGC